MFLSLDCGKIRQKPWCSVSISFRRNSCVFTEILAKLVYKSDDQGSWWIYPVIYPQLIPWNHHWIHQLRSQKMQLGLFTQEEVPRFGCKVCTPPSTSGSGWDPHWKSSVNGCFSTWEHITLPLESKNCHFGSSGWTLSTVLFLVIWMKTFIEVNAIRMGI